jgi:RNA polymerase sigma factor (sigma-70 family)
MNQPSEVAAIDLVQRVRAGDEAAWAELTERYTGLLWSLARGMRLGTEDAADAVQVTWLRLVERLDTVREPERVGGWLATTMRRECLAILRRRERTVVTDEWEAVPDTGDPLDEALLRTERDAVLWRAFRSLQSRCQMVLRVLMADPPPSYADAADALDMPIGSLGPTRKRCLATLRRLLLAQAYPFDAARTEIALQDGRDD